MQTIQALTQAHALEIAEQWQYPAPYDFYNLANDPEDLAELLDPIARGSQYFALLTDKTLLAYFCVIQVSPTVVEFGLGVRPELTGQGQGQAYLTTILRYIEDLYHPTTIQLAVATFNQRAIHLYEKIGFLKGEIYQQATNGSHYPFLRMKRTKTNPYA